MELARDVAEKDARRGRGIILDQFANPDNPLAHYGHRAGNLARDGRTHYAFRQQHGYDGDDHRGRRGTSRSGDPAVCIVGCQPEDGSQIPGIRSGPKPTCRRSSIARASTIESVSQGDAEEMTPPGAGGEHLRRHFVGRRHGRGAASGRLENATIVSIVCDRGDRAIFRPASSRPDEHGARLPTREGTA